MMSTDDETEASLRRVALGIGHTLDHWRARQVERREQREQHVDDAKLDRVFVAGGESEPFVLDPNDPFTNALIDAIGYAIAEVAHESRQELRRELAELRHQLRVTRSTVDGRSSTIVDLPNWRRNSNAA